jgi:hypothetical protein
MSRNEADGAVSVVFIISSSVMGILMACIPVETNRVPLPIDDCFDVIDFWCLTSLSAIFQPFHGDQF